MSTSQWKLAVRFMYEVIRLINRGQMFKSVKFEVFLKDGLDELEKGRDWPS